VDDDEALLRVTARGLRAAGAAVTECSSAEAAMAEVDPGSFDVVVSDIDMPGLSGVELVRVLRSRGLDVPVILVTGSPSIGSAVEAVELGAFKYLMKPMNLSQLVATVEAAARKGAATLPAAGTRTGVARDAVLGERYRLGRLIGEGGMSEVREATDLSTGRPVAVKVLHEALNARPEMRHRLLRESRAVSEIGHPNVVEVLDTFELGDGTPVLVMSLLHGETLGALLARRGKLPLADAADLLLPVVSAVGTAHAHGLIHRDLKPDNIFLSDEQGRTVVRVVDFGLAKRMAGEDGGSAPLTATGVLLGTPGYMSPEQGLGEGKVDHRTDIWSLGAILYEALTGVCAVTGESVGQKLKALFTEKVPPIAGRAGELPQSFATLVDRMLAPEPADRPGDLREVYAGLSAHARVGAPPFGPPAVASAEPR
jgi:DNA-binding response OmpR family regulator